MGNNIDQKVEPLLVNAEPNQDIAIMVDGEVVVYIQARKVRRLAKWQPFDQYIEYNNYEYIGAGVTTDDQFGNKAFIGGFAATMNIEVPIPTLDHVIEAVAGK